MRLSHAMAALTGLSLLLAAPATAQISPRASLQSPPAWQPQASRLTPSVIEAGNPLGAESSAGVMNLEIDESGPHHSKAVALMIAGTAGLVTGLLVDEDILTIAGAGVAGVGLYLYLR